MKNLELNSYGVQEMNVKELNDANGGGFWEKVAELAVGEIITHWDDFKQGLKDGWNAK